MVALWSFDISENARKKLVSLVGGMSRVSLHGDLLRMYIPKMKLRGGTHLWKQQADAFR
jgi:hypothetical protein